MAVLEIYKIVKCTECGQPFRAILKVGVHELKDGYHGECYGGFCGGTYFEPVTHKTK